MRRRGRLVPLDEGPLPLTDPLELRRRVREAHAEAQQHRPLWWRTPNNGEPYVCSDCRMVLPHPDGHLRGCREARLDQLRARHGLPPRLTGTGLS
jgi:hypothetical protein